MAIEIPLLWWLIVPVSSVLALIFAYIFYRQIMAADPGDENMQAIAAHVRDGAYAYLKRQYKVVAVFFVIVAALLALMAFGFNAQHKLVFVGFLAGGFFSGLAGFYGMKTATAASNRTAQGAKESLNRGLQIAFRAGAVTGLVVVGLGLLNISIWFFILVWLTPQVLGPEYTMSLAQISIVMLCFGMGASFQALFARVGGGIFTKAADVGADLVGKVEAGIPEDDPRNPATIADNVGDNVGDVAGMGADLYESYCNSVLAAGVLGVAAANWLGRGEHAVNFMVLPMIIAGVGILLSIFGIYLVRTKAKASMKQLMGALERGINTAAVLTIVGTFAICYWLLRDAFPADSPMRWWGIGLSTTAGLLAGVLIGKFTEYYTSYESKPTQGIAAQAETGPGTVMIAGLAEGMKSTWAPLAIVIVAMMVAFGAAGGFSFPSMGLYGVGIAAVGMLATLGITLATDAYGPIADNAGGNAEMTHQDPEVRKRTDALDSLGNTTAATGKGFAIGSAALTALALLATYAEQVRFSQDRCAQEYVVSANVELTPNQIVYMGHNLFAGRADLNTTPPAKKSRRSEKSTEVQTEAQPDPTYQALMLRSPDNTDLTEGAIVALEPNSLKDNGSVQARLGVDDDSALLTLTTAPKASLRDFMYFYDVTLLNPRTLCGMFSGVLLAFLFCALTMKAVGRAANSMVIEVRRQFKEIPGIMDGSGQPDYARCVDISTAGAQREMVAPSLLALIVPIAVGLIFGVAGVLGLLAGGLVCGFALAIFMANAGGAWDNAKKWIETGKLGGKGSDAHKAAVVGDTVGDPFKDTSGPSLNILIKLMSMVSVVFAGVVVKFGPVIAAWLGMK